MVFIKFKNKFYVCKSNRKNHLRLDFWLEIDINQNVLQSVSFCFGIVLLLCFFSYIPRRGFFSLILDLSFLINKNELNYSTDVE